MALTREQIIQNITAMESQGAPPQDIQAYVSSVGGAVQAPQAPQAQEAPNFFNLQAAKDVFSSAGQQVAGAQQEQVDQNFSLGSAIHTGKTLFTQGVTSPFRALGAGFSESHQGQYAAGVVVDKLTSFGQMITPDSVQNYIGDKATEIFGGYESMTPHEQQVQKNRLAFAEILSYMVGGPAVKEAVVGPTVRGAKAVTESGAGLISRAGEVIGSPQKSLDIRPTPKPNRAIEIVTDAFQRSFVDDSSAMNKAFAKLSDRQGVPTATLIRNMVTEGVFPKVRGKLADFTDAVGTLSDRQSRIGSQIDGILAPRTEATTLSSLRGETEAILANSPQIDVTLDTALGQVGRFFEGLERKTKTAEGFKANKLNPTQLNQVRKNMNAQTRAFRQAEFHQDVADAVADAVRKRLDVLEPRVRELNVDWAQLQGVKQTTRLLQFKPINVGVFGSQMGRLAAATALGASGVATGSGSLVIAGIVAHFGGEAFANVLRKRILSPKAQKVILDAIRKNPNFAKELVNDAKGRDKSLLAKELLVTSDDPAFENIPIKDNASFKSGETPEQLNQKVVDFREGKVDPKKAKLPVEAFGLLPFVTGDDE